MQNLLKSCLFAAVVALIASSVFARPPRKAKNYELRPQRAPGVVDRVEAALEVTGDNKLIEDSKVQRIKMEILANVAYDERLLPPGAASDGPLRSIRHYEKAAVLLKLEGEEIRPSLRDDRRLVGVEVDAPSVTLFSPVGPLSRDELDLLEMHGAGVSLLAYRLLPERPVAVGDTWQPSAELMAAMLDLDAVSKTDVQCSLSEVTRGTAEVAMSGRVEGAVDGVATQIELKAKYHFSLAAGRITWFGLLSREIRSIGHVGPGVEALSRLQMKFTPAEESPRLTDAALSGLSLTPTPETTLLSYESPEGGWAFVHDRSWHVTADQDRLAILRRIDRGELIAQCNIHTLSDASDDEQLTLDDFQNDIRHALGDSFGQFLQASQRANDADYRVYRVVVTGEAEQLPIQWSYYLVADEHGRKVVLAFTVESSLVDRFGVADEELLAALRLDAPKVAAKPTPARSGANDDR